MLPSDVYGTIAGMRVGPVPGSSMIFAFMDGVNFLQYGYRPTSMGRCPYLVGHFDLLVRGIRRSPVRSRSGCNAWAAPSGRNAGLRKHLFLQTGSR